MPGKLSSDGTHYIYQQSFFVDAPLVVFIHGIGYYHFHFDLMAEFFYAQGYSTLQYDNIGMGFSLYPDKKRAKLKHTWNGEGHVTQLHTLLNELHLTTRKYCLIGHSMGGAIATMYAKMYHDELLAVVLLAPTGMMDMPIKWHLLRRLVRHIPLYHSHIKSKRSRGRFRLESIKKFGDFVDPDSDLANQVATAILCMHLNNEHAYDAFWNCLCHFPLNSLHSAADHLAGTSINVLLLSGDCDTTTPLSSNYDRWCDMFHNARHSSFSSQVIPNSAHGFFLERSQLVHSVLAAWLHTTL